MANTLTMSTSTGEDRATLRDDKDRGAIPADTFASRLMLVRVHAGYLTIKQAAEACGLNYGSWSNWERGSRPQDWVDVLDAISGKLGIDRTWLERGGPLSAPDRNRRRRIRPNERSARVPGRTTVRRPLGRPLTSGPDDATRRPARTGLTIRPLHA